MHISKLMIVNNLINSKTRKEMKLKHVLTLLATAICTTGGWAQTDVTSTYFTDASFESADAATANVATTKALSLSF